jgi:hypothetical protein
MMLKLIAVTLVVFSIFVTSVAHARGVHVRGHTTKLGNYVAPHMRTSPDHSRLNNWSAKGNVNPYTGKYGSKNYR